MRLAQLPPEQRWQSVRAVQHLGISGGQPPSDAPPLARTPVDVANLVNTAVIVSQVLPAPPPPPQLLRVPAPPAPLTMLPLPSGPLSSSSTSSGGASVGSSSRSGSSGSSSGLGSGDMAILLAAVVVGSAIAIAILIPAEGLRYDGWIAVHPDEPLFLRTDGGERYTVPLSLLTPELAQVASGAELYEGPDPRFARLARAPLDRRGFGMSWQALVNGVPQADRSLTVGVGGHVNFAVNFADLVSISASIGASGSTPSTGGNTLLATLGPELMLLPWRWAGAYAGGGYAYRDIWARNGLETRNDGYYVRGGLIGEIPLTTRLSLQGRAGAGWMDLGAPGGGAFFWETSFGVAVY